MTQEEKKSVEKITRLDVINHATRDKEIGFGRILSLYKEFGHFGSIEFSYQDEGRTLKIFLNP